MSGLEFWNAQAPEDIDSTIWKFWQAGTRYHWTWRCPHCGERFVPRFSCLEFEGKGKEFETTAHAARETAMLAWGVRQESWLVEHGELFGSGDTRLDDVWIDLWTQVLDAEYSKPLLIVRPATRQKARHLGPSEFLRGENAAMPSDDPASLVDQHRVRPAPLANAGRNLRHLRVAVRASVARVRHERCDGSALDEVRLPCPLLCD